MGEKAVEAIQNVENKKVNGALGKSFEGRKRTVVELTHFVLASVLFLPEQPGYYCSDLTAKMFSYCSTWVAK